MENLVKIDEAVKIASNIAGRDFTRHNIMYLVQYGKINAIRNKNGVFIDKNKLEVYCAANYVNKKNLWINKYGDSINWHLAFDKLKEADTTKHVHRLHPYKGKFIPQLVEYFLDNKIDDFKQNIYFNKGETVLDPFAGSGTTLIQANELGINAIGIDISIFNCMIINSKLSEVDIVQLTVNLKNIEHQINAYKNLIIDEYISELDNLLKIHNKNLTAPVINKNSQDLNISKQHYIDNIFKAFYTDYLIIKDKYNLEYNNLLPNTAEISAGFLNIWYFKNILDEMQIAIKAVNNINDESIKQIANIILSRTIRSCRATTHSDLATLIKPQIEPYYCHKHNKICRPIMTIKDMFKRYANDTIKRLIQFRQFKTQAFYSILQGDSRDIDILNSIKHQNINFYNLLKHKKIDGIFSSPPYVGQIDYHEQHAYAYELFNFARKDDKEIGPLFKGQGKGARQEYINGISAVLNNCKKFLKDDYNIFLVANDKYNLYPHIAQKSGMKIVNQFKRPVLNRTEKDKTLYAEEIFHLKAI